MAFVRKNRIEIQWKQAYLYVFFHSKWKKTLGSSYLKSFQSIQKGLYVFLTTNLCPSIHGNSSQLTCALTERLR